MSEFIDNMGVENDPSVTNNGPWGEEYQQSIPPFNDGKNQSADTFESEKGESESDDYRTFEGVEYRNIDKIDISTNQGKFEWLYSLVDNASTRIEHERYDMMNEAGFPSGTSKEELEDFFRYDDAYQDNKREAGIVRRQSKILENLDINGEGGILGAIERKRNAFAEVMNNPNTPQHTQEAAMQNWDAAANLYAILAGEIAHRDPNYFGQNEMRSALDSEVMAAEQRVEQSMLDGYFGEDGFLHKSPDGEKMPSTLTEDAEIDLKNAKQDAETFNLLMGDYRAANDHMAPYSIRKEDFAPTIDKFIEDHTNQINQLIAESKNLVKGTPEYAENEAKRKQLARERSSARRLNIRYFSISEAK